MEALEDLLIITALKFWMLTLSNLDLREKKFRPQSPAKWSGTMSMRNKEIKLDPKVVTSLTAGITLGGQVPAGMKRWVTFVQIDSINPDEATNVAVHLASVGVSNPSIASIVATGNRKAYLPLRGGEMSSVNRDGLFVPQVPNPNTPLFSIAGSKWLGVAASVTTGFVTIGYFDE